MIEEMKSTKLLRFAILSKRKKLNLITKVIQKFLRFYYGFEVIISEKMSIGKDVRFAHNGLGTVINQEVIIGNSVKIYQNVTLGSNKKMVNGTMVNEGAPKIKDGVTIFTGAVVVGDVIIGENSVIGANVVVTEDISPNTIVFSSKAHVKKKDSNVYY